MLAIVEVNGKQYRVEEGRYLDVDTLQQGPDEEIEFGNVLMIVDGDNTQIGTPFIEGATIKAKVLSHGRKAKVLVYKMRRKKGYRVKNGHRQGYTKLQIDAVNLPGAAKKAPAQQAKKAEATEAPAADQAAE
jgi:large subunit ribosomal protein L21